VVLIVLVVALAAAGAGYQYVATRLDERRYPPEGELFDVGGHRLHIVCQGNGLPAVILDAGLEDSWLAWTTIQPEVAKQTRVCSYDRAGMGYSDAGPAPRDSRNIVKDLYALLTNAHVPPPYVLVGHSFGGFNTRLYAYTHPSEVAALVLVDVANEDQVRLGPPSYQAIMGERSKESCRQARRAPFGIERLRGVSAADSNGAVPERRALLRTLGFRSAWYRGICEEITALTTSSAQELRTSSRPLTIPVYVVHGSSHMAEELEEGGVPRAEADSFAHLWLGLHQRLMSMSPDAHFITADHSGHYIQFDQPELVLQAISDAIARVRGQPGRQGSL
jgi:pimeloyl-ACP methyl ester carboxylesterase